MRVPCLVLGVVVAVMVAGCNKKQATPPSPFVSEAAAPPALQAPPPEAPAECREYAAKLTRCIDSPSFPPQFREPQRSALGQMMASWRVDELPAPARPEALAAAAENCRLSLENMKDSGQHSCPGIF